MNLTLKACLTRLVPNIFLAREKGVDFNYMLTVETYFPNMFCKTEIMPILSKTYLLFNELII